MHFAAHGGHAEVVEALVAAEGSALCIQMQTVGGYTPRTLAHTTEVESLLLQASARFIESSRSGDGHCDADDGQVHPQLQADGTDDSARGTGTVTSQTSPSNDPTMSAACFSGWVVVMDRVHTFLWGGKTFS